MALINKSNLATGNIIQAQDILNIVQALDGTSTTTTIIATGSFSGSLIGQATSASFATTASYALNASGGAGFPYSGSAVITGSLNVTQGITGSLYGTASSLDPTTIQTTRMYKEVGSNLSSAAYTASIDLTQGVFYPVRADTVAIDIHFTSSVAGYEYEFFITQLDYTCSFTPGTGITMYSEDNYRKANKVGSAIVAKYITETTVALIGSLKP